ncbi:Multidrug resistance-associated protein 1, partial [Coemansia sp. RSA 1939]
SSISNMIGFKSDILKFKSKVEKLREFMDVDGEKMVVENAITPEKQWPSAGKIELRDFNMRYHEDLELALKNINLTIEPGEKIGIVGRTGAGKTSLTRALFHMVDSKNCTGSIMIDGHDILSLNIRDLRPKLGIIPQEPTMFKGSFRQNLDPLVEYNIEDMWSAPLITKNKSVRRHGLSRHAGNSFSEGQQQLFGLCRLLMRNRKIVVLDEATASVDLETDRQVHSLIQSEFKDCTVLTIAHRLETVMRSERVIVMDGGRIVEVGPPAELLASNGHFSELVKANDFGQ